MLDKYIKMDDAVIVCGQDAKTSMWYCKELPAHTTAEADVLIGEMNKILNKYNSENVVVKKEK